MHECVGAFLTQNASVLLGKRSAERAFYPNVWDVFGGHVEPGESHEQALKRELMEELGIRVKSSRYLETLITSPSTKGDRIECRLYVVTDWSGTPENRQPEEHSEIQWFRFEDALSLDLAAPEYARIIGDFAFSMENP